MKAIELRDVTVEVPGLRILDRINWSVGVGQKVAVLGPNGCGKSTLLRTLTGYGHVTSGCVRVLGETIGQTEIHQLRKRLGVVDPKLARLLDDGCTAQALVATGHFGHLTTHFDRPSQQQLRSALAALEQLEMGHIANQPFETLSSGQFSRAWLARAMINQPELLILDEPTSDLDFPGREALLRALADVARKRPKLTIVTVTHHLEDLVPDTDQILLLSRGKSVASGPPEEILTSTLLRRAFHANVTAYRDGPRWRWQLDA